MVKVFVYGTLKRGGVNHYLLDNDESTLIAENAEVSGYTLVNTPYFPFAVPKTGSLADGELYEVTDKVMRSLDRLEGYPDLYQKDTTRIKDKLTKEEHFPCYIYVDRNKDHVGDIKQYGTCKSWKCPKYSCKLR